MKVGSTHLAVARVSAGAILACALLLTIIGCGSGDEGTSTSATTVIASSTTTAGVVTTRPAVWETAGQSTSTSDLTTDSETSTSTTQGNGSGKSTSTTQRTTSTSKSTTTTAGGPTVLQVTGPSGTKNLSMAQLKAMNSVEGWGGWKNQLANITAPTRWKGVPVRTLMNLVGGGDSVVVTASDGYQQTLSAAQLAGQVNLYDPVTGDSISSISGAITVIVAYLHDGSGLGSGEGPLRVAFVSPSGDQVTDSAPWVKFVTKITAQ